MSEIISKTKNPLIRMVMEIIRTDSQNHHRVQELIERDLPRTDNVHSLTVCRIVQVSGTSHPLRKRYRLACSISC